MSDANVSAGDAAQAPAAWNFKSTALKQQWKYSSPLIGCRFSPAGNLVATAAQDFSIQLWDVATGENKVLAAHDSWLRALAFAPDGKRLYSAGYDGLLLTWQLDDESTQPARRIEAHQGWIRWLSISADGKLLATAGNDLLVKVWEAESGQQVHEFSGHEAHIYSTLFHPTEPTLLSGDLLGKVQQWNLSDGKLQRSLAAEELYTPNEGQGAKYGGVRSMSLSPDGKQLACGGLYKASNPFGAVQEPLIVVIDWEQGEKVRSQVADGIDRGIAWRCVYHPSGILVGASGGPSGGFLLFWEPTTDTSVHKFALPNTVLDMDIHPATNRIATTHHDRHLRICETA